MLLRLEKFFDRFSDLMGWIAGILNLLMLINFFPPAGGGGVYRPLSFVKYLSRAGWRITVVTPKPGEFWITDPTLEAQVPESVRVVRTPSISAQRVRQAV